MEIQTGERYQRRKSPRDYVWVTSHAFGSVGYRHRGGQASMPDDLFRRNFEPAPQRSRTGAQS